MSSSAGVDAETPLERPDELIFSRSEITAIMSGLMLAMLLASLDQTIVATSLSAMARDLQGWELMSWVVSAYLVASTVTTPIYGRLSDLYGRRPVLLVSIALFVAASILCALAQTMPQLIAARCLQGLGGGGLRSISQAVVADIVPPRERGRYQGYFSTTFGISNTLGPVLGGLFADYLTWHWIFWINLPLGFLAFALSNHHLKRLKRPTRHPIIDWAGAALILAALTPLLIGVSRVETAGWSDPGVWGAILVGLLLIGALLLREAVAPEPMLPLRLFKSRVFSVASLVTFLNSTVMIGSIVLVPLGYQLTAGVTARDAGLRLITMTAGTVLGSFIAGQTLMRLGRYRIFPILGTGLTACCCLALGLVGLGHALLVDLALTLALGLSFGGQLAPLTVAVQNALDWRDTGIGMSCLMLFRVMGGAFGVALLSTVLIGGLDAGALTVPGHEALGPAPGIALLHLDELGPRLTPALHQALDATIDGAFRRMFLIAAAIAALGFAAALALKEVPLRGRGEAAKS